LAKEWRQGNAERERDDVSGANGEGRFGSRNGGSFASIPLPFRESERDLEKQFPYFGTLARVHPMPIQCPITLNPVSDEEFESVDRLVMSASYSSQNHLGRLCNERVYEKDVVARLRAGGMSEIHTQVPVTVTHETYLKTYWLDLVVGQMIYELKSVDGLVAAHETQAIHYAALVDTNRVKLINFGSPRVAGQLLRTPFRRVDRRRVTVVRERWERLCDQCGQLIGRLLALLEDWGAFLEASFYSEGLAHFFGGEARCVCRLPVCRDGLKLGTHRLACHAKDTGFIITALGKEARPYEEQLRRLLSCLPLQGIQWFNLNHTELHAVTLLNGR
jgi:GxxExxY protein